MTAPIYVKPPRRINMSYTLSPDMVDLIRKEAKKQKIPAARLVEAILRERLVQEESKCR